MNKGWFYQFIYVNQASRNVQKLKIIQIYGSKILQVKFFLPFADQKSFVQPQNFFPNFNLIEK